MEVYATVFIHARKVYGSVWYRFTGIGRLELDGGVWCDFTGISRLKLDGGVWSNFTGISGLELGVWYSLMVLVD